MGLDDHSASKMLGAKTETEVDSKRERERETETERERERDRDTKRERQREREREFLSNLDTSNILSETETIRFMAQAKMLLSPLLIYQESWKNASNNSDIFLCKY